MPVEIITVQDDRIAEFFHKNERESLHRFYNFPVIWHEQEHRLAAVREGEVLGAAHLQIAASLCTIGMLTVASEHRRQGIGRALLDRAEEIANYYNCHKMTGQVLKDGTAQQFLQACGYHVEAILPQHTFKLDMAVLRKFLL